MVTMKVFIDVDGFCRIVNGLNNSMTYDWGETITVKLKRTRKCKYEVQVPIQTIGQFIKKNETTVNLWKLQQLNNKN